MFGLSDFWGFLFAAKAHEAAEEELRERQQRVDDYIADYDRQQEDDRLFYQHLDEERKREEQQHIEEERDWYNSEREQLEWEMRNADLYGYDKEDIQSRMDYLNDREQNEDWYSDGDNDY